MGDWAPNKSPGVKSVLGPCVHLCSLRSSSGANEVQSGPIWWCVVDGMSTMGFRICLLSALSVSGRS